MRKMAWVTIAAIAAAVSVVGGCGNGSPDQQVHDKLNAARVAASGGEQGPHDALSNAQATDRFDASSTRSGQTSSLLKMIAEGASASIVAPAALLVSKGRTSRKSTGSDAAKASALGENHV